MKRISILILLLFYTSLAAQNDANVMSYYASDNNLDGQPRIDMTNVMRFFPVFAIQDSVTAVNITIYYGNKIFDANADKMAGGKYWQTMLPDFKLGDAIQRVEVSMTFSMRFKYQYKLEELSKMIDDKVNERNNLRKYTNEEMKTLAFSSSKITDVQWSSMVNVINYWRDKNIIQDTTVKDFESFKPRMERVFSNVISISNLDSTKQDSVLRKVYELFRDSTKYSQMCSLVNQRNKSSQNFVEINNEILNEKENLEEKKDSTIKSLYNDIVSDIADSSLSGPAIKKSDITISDNFSSATLLYRYYQNNLRYRKALDPAEHLGIFRARYIPFPVTGTPSDNKVQLFAPMQTGSPAVFEVGLSFGDDVVSGNNTFNPVFSASRLGVAMVITEKLFSSDAQIIGLALTYDFNSYASIGVGRNLAQGKSFPYYSFGINKKAFEQLISALAGLFK